jgi:hypothetical protein
MKRRFPRTLWYGLVVVLAAPVLYLALFIRFPITRDVPWASLVMFGVGLGLLLHGLLHAYRHAATSRGKVVAPIALTFSLALTAFFCWTLLYQARQIPDSLGAPRVGQMAPDFTLPDQDGRPVSLAQLLTASPDAVAPAGAGAPADAVQKANGVVLVFYRGYW